jgi:hypothetical protein
VQRRIVFACDLRRDQARKREWWPLSKSEPKVPLASIPLIPASTWSEGHGGIDSGLVSDLAFSLSGNSLNNSLTGNRADNTLNGGAGADFLNGGTGFDTLIGGAGDDNYFLFDVSSPSIIVTTAVAAIPVLSPSYDTVTEAAGGGTDTVLVAPIVGANAPTSYTLSDNVESGISCRLAFRDHSERGY